MHPKRMLGRTCRTMLLALPALLVLLAGSTNAADSVDSFALGTKQDPKDILLGLNEEIDSDYLDAPQKILSMPNNPAYFIAQDGKELFHKKRGPNNASLAKCDFGQGPGKLKGAYVKLPRYFEDTGRVMNAESRLVYCMKTIQGFSEDSKAVQNRGDLKKMLTYIASQSNGYEWAPSVDDPMEKAMRDAGEAMFYRRAGKLDQNCATCHYETGTSVRASAMPSIQIPQEWTKAVSWPAFRLGKRDIRSPYQRIRGCYYQMRKGLIQPRSDAAIAMQLFWLDSARGQPAILPDLKR
ncbi:MAG: sulfur oxidation c-type cytochrome SoxA [Thiohalorhabdaceae bacterium]